MPANSKKEVAVFGSGCFWCSEAVFKMLKGVVSVESGYAGGNTEYPTYEEVSSGETGHAEVVKIVFDPDQIKYRDLLTVFFASHDPTSLNRQGNDVGTQYRSVIFVLNATQEKEAKRYIEELNSGGELTGKVVTEVAHFREFYPAEDYHQEYFKAHRENDYCQLVIVPKMEKIRAEYERLIKK